MLSLVLSFAAITPAQPAGHEAANPLYKGLLDPGLVVGPGTRIKFPAPLMPDGLDAAGQKAVIQKLIGMDYSYEEFTRKSVVAPNLLKIGEAKSADPAVPIRTVDTYFVTYGDFKATEDDKFLDRLVSVGKGEGKGKSLTRDELTKRGITLAPGDEKREGYGQVEFDFLEKVRLKLTGHAMWSRGAESVLAAAEIDSRFRDDAQYPNEWQSLSKEGGQQKLGPAQKYGGAGMYLKVTKLTEPVGAIFVEQHIVFAEPVGWFDGANLLRSKLPIVVQTSVRNMRREWQKGPGK